MKESDYLAESKKAFALLRKIDRFQQLTADETRSFLRIGKFREYEQGEEIVRKGEVDSWAYFLITGEAKIVKDSKILAVLRRSGDLFGEMAVIDGSPRTATIWAQTKCLVLGVDCSLMDKPPKANELAFQYTLFRLFSEVLAARLKDTTDELVRLKTENKKLQDVLEKARKNPNTVWL